jgi:hypothetical protein
MGSALVLDLPADTLLTATLFNPLDVYKILTVDLLQTSLDVLGPAGAYANEELGSFLPVVLFGLLAVWILVPLPIGYRLFKRTDFR